METTSHPVRQFYSSAVLAKNALFAWLNPAMWITQLFFMSLFQMAFFVYVATYIDNPEISVAFVAVGNALQSISYVAIFAVCNITGEEKQQGTLPNILVSPANRFSIFVGRAMFQILNGLATVAIAFLYAAVLFGVDFSQTDFVALAVTVLVTTFAMVGFGLMLSSLGLYLRTSMIVANIFLFAGLLLCGVNFPISYLPTWLQPVSYAIPMTYGTAAAREAVSGGGLMDIGGLLIAESIVGIVAVLIGYGLMMTFERISRSKGTLEKF